MRHIGICALGVIVLAQAAGAADATVWLSPKPGQNYIAGNHLFLGFPGPTAIIQVWLSVSTSAGYKLLDFQAITDSTYQIEGMDHFEVVGFSDQGPYGAFGRVDPRGSLDDGTPDDPDGMDGYQIVYDGRVGTPPYPWTSEDGIGPGTYLLDEIIIKGVDDTTYLVPDTATADKVTFRTAGGVQPSGYKVYTGTGTSSTYYDAVVAMGTGRPWGGKGVPANPLYVSTYLIPEAATLSLLALGSLAALRRRR